MPTYVYRFVDSGKIIEVQQAFTDEPFTTLTDPIDGTVRAVKKVFTPVGVSFKGGGFYKTDSRIKSSSSSGTPAAATTANTSDSAGSGDSVSSTASASTSDTSTSDTSSTPASTPASSVASGTPSTTPST